MSSAEVDSSVETASGLILIWRLVAERRAEDPRAVEDLDKRARRLVAASLFALAAWVAFDATHSLWTGERPQPTLVGIAVTATLGATPSRPTPFRRRRAGGSPSSRSAGSD